MAQYCRYCSFFVTGNGSYCTKKYIEISDKYAKRTNHCKEFELNPMDAFGENEKGYCPREQKTQDDDWEQLRLEDFLEVKDARPT